MGRRKRKHNRHMQYLVTGRCPTCGRTHGDGDAQVFIGVNDRTKALLRLIASLDQIRARCDGTFRDPTDIMDDIEEVLGRFLEEIGVPEDGPDTTSGDEPMQ